MQKVIHHHHRYRHLLLAFALGLLLTVLAVAIRSASRITVTGAGLPAALANPTSDQGPVLNKSIMVYQITLANNTASTQTVGIQDCQSTPFVLFDGSNGSTMAAGDKWFMSWPNGMRFQSCFKWTASSTSVQGSLTGEQ